MSEELEFITNGSQIEAVSQDDIAWEAVSLKGLRSRGGKTPSVRVYAVTAGEYQDYLDSANVYKDGVFVGKNFKNEDVKFLYWAVRDHKRNHIWRSLEEAVTQIRSWPRPVQVRLNIAANKINTMVPDEVVEGNSEGGQNESSSSGSAPTSESGTSTGSPTESP